MRFTTFILALLILSHVPVKAQRERNYIYLFDCTQSMQKLQLWDHAKEALDRTLQKRAVEPESHVCIFPFQSIVYPAVKFDSKDYTSHHNAINKKFDEYITKCTNTNIVAALNAAEKECNPNMDNRVYLFTDGQQSKSLGGPEAVRKALSEWCDKHRNTRLFYIMLDKAAVDKEIIKFAEYCKDIIPIELKNGTIPQIADIQQTTIYTNTLELDRDHKLQFSEPGDCPIAVDCNDRFFAIDVVDGNSHNGTMRVRISPKNALTPDALNHALADYMDANGNYTFNATFRSTDNGVIIANPEVRVVVANRAMRHLNIADGVTDEIIIKPGAEWYDSFIWSKAKDADTLRIDLAPEFNNACTSASSATFSIEDNDDDNDFTLLFNGTQIAPEEPFTLRPDMPAVIEIVFHPNAKEGKRYFKLEPESVDQLETINSIPISELNDISIRTSYDVAWNPLKTAFLWIIIALLTALAAWFTLLKPIIYPSIKANKIIITGPDSYFRTVRIKSAQRVLLTSHSYKQGIVNRLFKGRIIFVRAPHWTSDLEMVPGSKKNVRIRTSGGWMVMPSSTLSPNNEYELIGPDGKKQSDLTLN